MSDEYVKRLQVELRRLGIDRPHIDRISAEVADHVHEAAERGEFVDFDTLLGTPSDLATQFQDALWTKALRHAHHMLIAIGAAALSIVTIGEGIFGWTDSWPSAAHSTWLAVTIMCIGLALTTAAGYLMLFSQPGFGRTVRQWQMVRTLHLTAITGTALTVLGLGLWTAAQTSPPLWWVVGLGSGTAGLAAGALHVHRLSTRLGSLAASIPVADRETLAEAMSAFWRPAATATPQERPLVLSCDLKLLPAEDVLRAEQSSLSGPGFLSAAITVIGEAFFAYAFVIPFSAQRGGDEGLAVIVFMLVGAFLWLVKRQLDDRRRSNQVGRS